MEKTVNAQSPKSTIKEFLSIIKDGEIKDSILSLKVFQGIEFSKDKETQTPVIYLYGEKGGAEEVKAVSAPIPTKKKTISESRVNSIIKGITGENLPSYLMEATKKVLPVMKLSVPYSNLNSIFIDTVQKYLTANKLIVTSVRQDSDNNFIVMFSNKNTNSQFLSEFIKEVKEYKDYTSMDARNINVARALTNTEIKQIVDLLNTKLSFIVENMFLDEKVRQIFGEDFLNSYKINFSIDSFIKKTKNNYSESAIRNEALKLQEEVKTQNLKVDPPFEKWTSGDTKELPKQKKVSTLPVELEVKVQVSERKNNPTPQGNTQQVKTTTESVLHSLGLGFPIHLKEDSNIDSYKGIQPYSQKGNTDVSADITWSQDSSQKSKRPNNKSAFDTSSAEDAKFRDVNTSLTNYSPKQASTSNKDTVSSDTSSKNNSNGNNPFLTVKKLSALRDQFVRYAQANIFSIRTKNNNSNLFNDLPVVIGNGKDKYIKVDQKGINGLFTIEAALGEQSTLIKGANALYKHKDFFLTHGDNSTVQL